MTTLIPIRELGRLLTNMRPRDPVEERKVAEAMQRQEQSRARARYAPAPRPDPLQAEHQADHTDATTGQEWTS